jgi:hypothetical protein
MNNNILQSQCQFNTAFDNSESKELDKLARNINNKHSNKNMSFSKKFAGIVCDQLDCTPYSQLPLDSGNTQTFFSAQGDFSPIYAPINAPLLSHKKKQNDDSFDSSFDSRNSSHSSNSSLVDMAFDKKIYSESDSFNSLSSDPLDSHSLSSTYSSLPEKIKKKLKMNSTHFKKNKHQSNTDVSDIQHLKSCDDCRNKLFSLLQNTGVLHHENLLEKNTQQITKSSKKQSNSFLNLTNPELKDVMVLILIGVIIIMLIDIFVRQ